MKQLLAFARYGARIDTDIGRALLALRVLRDRSDAALAQSQDGTFESGEPERPPQDFTNDLSPRTFEPGPAGTGLAPRSPEAEPAAGNRHQRAALARGRRAA